MDSLTRLIALLREMNSELKAENDRALGNEDDRSDICVPVDSLVGVPSNRSVDGMEVIQK